MRKTFKIAIFLMLILVDNGIAYAQDPIETSLPTERCVFYSEGQCNIRRSVSSNISSDYWNITSKIENCFDSKNIGKYAWLMTADGETQLTISLTYTIEDSRYTIKSQEVKFYFYDGKDLFNDNKKELITDIEKVVGSYVTDNTEKTATVTITAPKSFPNASFSYNDNGTSAYYTFYVVIKVKFANGGTASVAKNIGVSRPGLLLLHGLGDTEKCFYEEEVKPNTATPLKNYLVEKKFYIPTQILAKDYSSSNTSSFDDNTNKYRIVRNGLEELSRNLFSIGIASTKYDMVGHSMGGILERLYNQEKDNQHTNKLITLNTPHYGSPLGNLYVVAKPIIDVWEALPPGICPALHNIGASLNRLINTIYRDDPSKDAIVDLAYNSEAIKQLNSSSISKLIGIPVYAVGTLLDVEKFLSKKVAKTNVAAIVICCILDFLLQQRDFNEHKNYLFEDVRGDGVVSLISQRGGLESSNYSSIFSSESFDAFHCNSPKWELVQNKIRDLLLAEPSTSNFCFSGFKSNSSSLMKNKPLYADSEYSSTGYITEFVEPQPSSFIHINMETVDGQEYTHKATLLYSNDMVTHVAFATLSENEMIVDYDKPEMFFDLYGYKGEVTFYAIGRTNYDALVIDSVKVNLSDANAIAELQEDSGFRYSIYNNEIKLENMSEPYFIIVYDIAGRKLASMNSNSSHTYSLPRKEGLLIFEVRTIDGAHTFKVKTNLIN